MPEYKDITYHCCQKIDHIASHYTEPVLISKNNDKSKKVLKIVQLRAIIFCQARDLKNLDLLNLGLQSMLITPKMS